MSTTISNGVNLESDYLKVADATKNQAQLDKDTFLSLLVTQMQYQDPMEPMDNSQMLAQLAQFTSLEQMKNVAQASEKQLASSMIGKYVQYLKTDSAKGTSEYVVGKVDYAKVTGDTPVLGIGETEVELSKVYEVYDSSNIESNNTAFELIGKTVQGKVKLKAADGTEESVVVEGEVKSVQLKDGTTNMVIGTDTNKMTVNYTDLQNVVQVPSITGRHVTGTYTDSTGAAKIIEGTAEYILMKKAGTYVYVQGAAGGQLVDFNTISNVKNN